MLIYQFTLESLPSLKAVVDDIRRHDRNLADQMLRAMTSIPLNIAEGRDGRGKNKQARFQLALGSAQETSACLDVALALGYVKTVPASLDDRMNCIIRTLAKLSRR